MPTAQDQDQAQFEETVLAIIEAIYASNTIPEDHKDQYVEHIEKNGITEKMLTELKKFFDQEEQEIRTEIEEKQELVTGLGEIMAEEQAIIDRPQAEILASVARHNEKKLEEFKGRLDEVEEDMMAAVESIGQEAEAEQKAAISEKLKGGEK